MDPRRPEDNSGGSEGPRPLFWLSIWSINITRLTASFSHDVSRVSKSFHIQQDGRLSNNNFNK